MRSQRKALHNLKLNILGKIVTVLRTCGLVQERNWAGYFDPHKSEIHLDSTLDGDYLNETFIHEFLEAVYSRASFNQSIEHQLKEVMIDITSKALNENFKLVHKRRS